MTQKITGTALSEVDGNTWIRIITGTSWIDGLAYRNSIF
jgi:hypothetical protein